MEVLGLLLLLFAAAIIFQIGRAFWHVTFGLYFEALERNKARAGRHSRSSVENDQ
jgi:hypothetical protein